MKRSFYKLLKIPSLLLTFTLITGCAQPASTGSTETPSPVSSSSIDFNTFTNELFTSEIASNTINLHFTLSEPESYGITDPPITLGDLSDSSIQESHAALENSLFALEDFDYSTLTDEEQLTYDILNDYMRTELNAADFKFYDEILRPSTGIQAQLPVLYEEYKFYDENDILDYLTLIPLTDEYFNQIIAYERKKADAGLFMSDFSCDNIISQCEDFIANPDGHYLIETFNNKVDALSGLSDTEKETYKTQNETAVKEHIIPAYQNLADAMSMLMGSGKNDMGLCYFDDGKEFYEYLVYYNTGCSKDIKDIETMIDAQRTKDLTKAASLSAADPSLWKKCSAVSLENTDPVATLNTLQDKMITHFPAAPDTEFTVSYIDECMEEYMAPAFYITSPIDNYTNNSIFINRQTDASTMRYFTTLAHEGFPGHLYQTVMSYEAGLQPVRSILNYPGYVEGWATYVEMLAYQYADLEETVAAMLELNQSALLSLYASTDLGIHYEGWSFDDTLAFWSSYGISDSAAIRNVYEFILEEPAHYLKYYVGYVEFLNLKEAAQKTYGNNYSDVAFHQAVLNIGPAPFDIVEKYLDDYYKAED